MKQTSSKPVEENMLDKDILQKALDKAVKNGYPDWGMPRGFAIYSVIFSHGFAKAFFGEEETCTFCGSTKFEGGRSYNADSGDDYWSRCSKCGTEPMSIFEFGIGDGTTYPAWAYQLQQMVLEENPVLYLERFL